MKIRTAKIAITPLWVIRHPEVYGNATRMAVYAGLQVAAFESPDVEWRSDRELAVSVGEVVGVSAEACRKHLAALRGIGAVVTLDGGDLYLTQDDPGLGIGVGPTGPSTGSGETQSDDDTSTYKRDLEREDPPTPPTAIELAKKDRMIVTDDFDAFWLRYPRRVGKQSALKAFTRALKKARLDEILYGLECWRPYWEARDQPEFIPHPSTWLNDERWNDRPPESSGSQPKLSQGAQALIRAQQRRMGS